MVLQSTEGVPILRKYLIALGLLIFLSGIAQSESRTPQSSKKMSELRSVFYQLLPDLFSDKEFNEPRNFKRIETNVQKLAELAHDIPIATFPSSDQDPSIAIISGLFKDETELALTHLRLGHRPYARSILKTIPNYCIGCHTRSTGLDLSSLDEKLPETLSDLERAEFLDATRQFNRALDAFEKILEQPSMSEERQIEVERAARYGIATAVRVKRDPQRALNLVDRILALRDAPAFLKLDALRWKTSLLEWKKEPSPQEVPTAESLFEEAKRLFAQAKSLQDYPSDRGADVLYLRASATLHQFLNQFPSDPNLGQALLLLGSFYETLDDLQLWSLHDLYYEACIRKFPQTPIAAACYARYEQSIFLGYTGSGGTYLPREVQMHLNELKKLAEQGVSRLN